MPEDGPAGVDRDRTFSSIENLFGSPHTDMPSGDSDVNTIDGAVGDDVVEGRGGADRLIGGDGRDTVIYGVSPSGVTVSLLSRDGSGGDAAGDTVIAFENLTGSAFADTLQGDTNDNAINGQAGDDSWWGSEGTTPCLAEAATTHSLEAKEVTL